MGDDMNLSHFHRDYLALQGVLILPKSRTVSRPIEDRTGKNVPVVPEYERGDL